MYEPYEPEEGTSEDLSGVSDTIGGSPSFQEKNDRGRGSRLYRFSRALGKEVALFLVLPSPLYFPLQIRRFQDYRKRRREKSARGGKGIEGKI